MQYGKLENGEVIYYQKPENILCEDPTLRGYKEGYRDWETDRKSVV